MTQVKFELSTFAAIDAVALARTHYGLAAAARALPSERDQNFYLATDAGRAYVLKISNTAETFDHLDLQNAALRHLATAAPTLSLPRVVPTLTGQNLITISAANGAPHFLRVLTYVPGRVWASVRPHSAELLFSLGVALGTIDHALADFQHPAAHRDLKWDLSRPEWIRQYFPHIHDPARRALVENFFARYEAKAKPLLAQLRQSVIYNDANDYNVLVSATPPAQVLGVIDFGDMLYSHTLNELAIGISYASMGLPNPIAAAASVVAGYHSTHALTEQELEILYPLIILRLCVSVTNSAYQQTVEPDNAYLTISEAPAWAVLETLAQVSPDFAHYAFRQACGLTPHPHHAALTRWLETHRAEFAPLVDADLREGVILDLSVGSADFGTLAEMQDTAMLAANINAQMAARPVNVALGRYAEARLVYQDPAFDHAGNDGPEQRTLHLGLDVFMAAGSAVYAPLAGVVHSLADNAQPKDYGPTLLLRHTTPEGQTFFTLYGHLSRASLTLWQEGMMVEKGQRLGAIGPSSENGDWPPHLHFQIITDLLGQRGNFPGVALASQKDLWLGLCPSPTLIVGECLPTPEGLSRQQILALRQTRLARNFSLTYRRPLHIVRGYLQYLYDADGRRYLDAVNNVPHVGHCHPRVVRAGMAQMAVLNTNTRYLHPNIVRYAERLCATLPEPLRVCFFVNSGSEANELALRLARTYTQSKETIVLDVAYHGNTNALIEISPYKYEGKGGGGRQPFVHTIPMPDDYRGPYRRTDALAGVKYARPVRAIIEQLHAEGKRLGAFIAESLMGSSGQIVFPAGFLPTAYAFVRAAGGVCIADEVQVGFGRVGTHFWGFETQAAVPDIVVLGKPMGNGHPLGAVITTPAIAEAFHNGMEYFSTFGGNPVSCAIGLAVLDVIESEQLQAKALHLGQRLMDGFRELARTYPIIGDVRGLGLFNGVELVKDRATLEPAPEQTTYIVNRLKERGVLVSIDGPFNNALKIKPPLALTAADVDFFVDTLGVILREDGAQI